MIALKAFADLDEWFIYNHPNDGLVICGIVSGHNRIEDGNHIMSSTIVRFGADTAETRHTYYSLGGRLTEINEYWVDRLNRWGLEPDAAILDDSMLKELTKRSALSARPD